VDRKPKASFVFDFVTDQALRPELIRIRFLSRIGRMKKSLLGWQAFWNTAQTN